MPGGRSSRDDNRPVPAPKRGLGLIWNKLRFEVQIVTLTILWLGVMVALYFITKYFAD